jgi:hypothetical protein
METKGTERPPGNENISPVPRNAFAGLLMPVAFLSMATLCLWMGALMSVRCERVPSTDELQKPTSIKVTVERRLFGVIPISKTTLTDVVGVGSFHDSPVPARRSRSDDIEAILTLRLSDGRIWNSPPAYAPVGTPPWQMAWHIAKFIENPSAQPLSFWCVSWMLHLAAAPLLLIGVLSAYFGIRSLATLKSSAQS